MARFAQLPVRVVVMLALILGPLALPRLLALAGRRSSQKPSLSVPIAVTPDDAVARALNEFQRTPHGWQLVNPRYSADFGPNGLSFNPRGGPHWGWSLDFVGAGDRPLAGVDTGWVLPAQAQPDAMRYGRGAIAELYLARQNALEQQFLIPGPLDLDGADLVIEGRVASAGEFVALADGWAWRGAEGSVRLGRVYVYDAAGESLPATMTVAADATRIVVAHAGLARAAYPVTVDPEIGANDFRLSDMGGDLQHDANNPAVAYNSSDHEYLVVWWGDDDTAPLVDGENEIFGQRVDAATGAELGTEFRLSQTGPDGNTAFGALEPAVAYNSLANEYLVVWQADHTTDDEFEIVGQRVEGGTGLAIGGNVQLSTMGPPGDPGYGASDPAVAYNRTQDEYLVVWSGDDGVDGENEIYGQRVSGASGQEVGGDDFRLSDMGPAGNIVYDAFKPAVAFDSANNQYLVVWHGDDTNNVEEDEIWGQRVDGATGQEVGADDARLSDMGPDGSAFYLAWNPAVAYNGTEGEFLVVWQANDDAAGLAPNEVELYGQRVQGGTGAEIGGDTRLSFVGPDGDGTYHAGSPAVVANSQTNEYFVTWEGDNDIAPRAPGETEVLGQRVSGATGQRIGSHQRLSEMGPLEVASFHARHAAAAFASGEASYLVVWFGDDLTPDEFEIYGQRVDAATGGDLGADLRLSDMGAEASTSFRASVPAVAYNAVDNEYLVVWQGRDNTGTLVSGEWEIFGQRVDAATGEELGSDFRLSDMGPDGNSNYGAFNPAAAYNSMHNEYLVVWAGDDDTGTLANDEFEIYHQRVSGATGAEIGTDYRLSFTGPSGQAAYDANYPAVAYNVLGDEYLVVWEADTDAGPLVDNEFEIFGQRVLGANGAPAGAVVRLSDMGSPDGWTDFGAFTPAVAYNDLANQYLVVWAGDDNTAPLVDNEYEIFGQRVEGATGLELGGDTRLSDMGPDSATGYNVSSPAVTYNSLANEYLVVWSGIDATPGEYEIYGQRVNAATGQELDQDVRLSDMGPDGDADFDAQLPAVSFNSLKQEYLVVWSGDGETLPLTDDEHEVLGQRVAGTGAEIGVDLRLSDMGPDGDADFDAQYPAVAFNPLEGEYLIVWYGDDDTPPLVKDEDEVFGQRFDLSRLLYLALIRR